MARDQHPHDGDRHGHDLGHEHGHGGLPALKAKARAHAEQRGVPFTAMRERVLEGLAQAGRPMAAYDLAEAISDSRKVAAVQIYRALEFLQQAGVVHRLASRSAYVTCDHEHHGDEAIVFMVCSSCGGVEETASEQVDRALMGAAHASGFKAHHPIVEIEGQCQTCQGGARPEGRSGRSG